MSAFHFFGIEEPGNKRIRRSRNAGISHSDLILIFFLGEIFPCFGRRFLCVHIVPVRDNTRRMGSGRIVCLVRRYNLFKVIG